METEITQDVVASNPQTMNKLDNTKRKKPWEVFKNHQKEDDKFEQVVQYDSFRDKCAKNQQSGSGFTALLNNSIQQDNNSQFKLNKNQYYQNLNKNKAQYGASNNQQSSRQTKSNYKQDGKNNQSKNNEESRFNNSVNNNFSRQNNFRSNHFNNKTEHTSNENTNNVNLDEGKLNGDHNKEGNTKTKYFDRKQKKIQNLIQQQANRALRREEGEDVSEDEAIKYGLSDTSSIASENEDKKQELNQSSSKKNKKRTGLSRRRQKICGSWVRVCDNQKLDKPPSYKDYLGQLTNAIGKRPLENMFNGKNDDELYEVNQEFTDDAEDGELKAVADLEDGEIKMQEEEFFLKNTNEAKLENATSFQFPKKGQYKPNNNQIKGKNYMNINGTKIINSFRKNNLEEEENDSIQRKKQKIPTKEELIEQETYLLNGQDKQEKGFLEPVQLLQRMDQLGNEIFKNKSGNNFQMQQTLAAQQDAFLQSYFGKQNQNRDPNNQGGPIGGKRDKKFDIKNYQVDLEKNMIDNNIKMTEGLKNLVKIQNELYISGMNTKKPRTSLDPSQSSIYSSGSGSKLNKILQQDSTEKEVRDASERLTNNPQMKELQSKLNFDSNKSHPLLLQKERKFNQYQDSYNKFEEKINIDKQKNKKQYEDDNKENNNQSNLNSQSNAESQKLIEEKQNQNETNQTEYDDLNEFEKFDEEFLRQQQIIEELQQRNKDKVNQINNSQSFGAGLLDIEDYQKEQDYEMNPLEKMISEELEKKRLDQQTQNYKLLELQKIQESQHMQNIQLLAKQNQNQHKSQQRTSKFSYQIPQQMNNSINSIGSLQQLLPVSTIQDSSNINRNKRSKFSDIQTLPNTQSNIETLAQFERLKQLAQQKTATLLQEHPKSLQSAGNQSLAFIQQQQFDKNQLNLEQQNSKNRQIENEYENRKFTKFSSQHNEQNNQIENNKEQETQAAPKVIAIENKDYGIEIPDEIKNKQKQMKPEMYEKVINDYIKLHKEVKEEEEKLNKIKDPRIRARAIQLLEEKNQQLVEKAIENNKEKINNFIPLANEDCLPLPSHQEEGDKSSILKFCIETNTMPANLELNEQNQSRNQDEKVIYNYKLLKGEKNMITQEKNLIEKNNTLSFIQDSQQNPLESQNLLKQRSEMSQLDEENSMSDLYKNDREIRYFKENNSIFCFKCNQNGHLSKWCTATVENKTQCVFCLGDHTKDYCANYVCFKCYNVGHRIKDCAYDQALDQMRCRMCRKKGHNIRYCGSLNLDVVIKNFDMNSMSETICAGCGETGHINCFNPSAYLAYDGLYKIDTETLNKLS